jgi:hypothetical protein
VALATPAVVVGPGSGRALDRNGKEMTAEKIFQTAGLLIGLATVTVVLTSPQTGNVIRQTGTSFTSALRAAMGR